MKSIEKGASGCRFRNISRMADQGNGDWPGRDLSGDWETLDPRALAIIDLIAQDYTYKEIAETLVLGHKTVEKAVGRVFQILGIHSKRVLGRAARLRGFGVPGPGSLSESGPN